MLPPVSLYIHFPWCIQKCPYCDFNSHQSPKDRPEADYIKQLTRNFMAHRHLLQDRPIRSIFIGGGTPSLIDPEPMHTLLANITQSHPTLAACEITLEANPGASDTAHFRAYKQAGVNRLSIGIQSFNHRHLKALGRVHNAQDAIDAMKRGRQAGFDNINIDLMFGLPAQKEDEAMHDLAKGIALGPNHLSWYQLTLEPNTAFALKPPKLPSDTLILAIYASGQTMLAQHGFVRYEVSAYAKGQCHSQHNLNYWHYGDYLGIGAGAHSKITRMAHNTEHQSTLQITRFSEARSPKRYLNMASFGENTEILSPEQIRLEYMMNTLRMDQAVHFKHYEAITGLERATLEKGLRAGRAKGWLRYDHDAITLNTLGKRYLNEVVLLF